MLIILQGRVRSIRLPGKGFINFFGKTIWERMFDIVNNINIPSDIVFATGNLVENTLVKPIAEKNNIRFFSGDEDNVLSRFVEVAKQYNHSYILRITCDNYLIQPTLIEKLYEEIRNKDADYGFIAPLSHYCGEIIKRKVLISAGEDGNPSKEALEHVTWDIRRDKSLKITSLPVDYADIDHEHGITLDTIDDLILMKYLENQFPKLVNVRCLDQLKKINSTLIPFC
jgi:spore coat polysaccharide biosynthesis protein SpsF